MSGPLSASNAHLVGVISDTHGLLRAGALAALAGCERIVHAGDVGSPDVLARLAAIAPVTAVRGNVDVEQWARELPETAAVEIGGTWIFVIHDLSRLDLDPAAAGFAVVISGHSHRPEARTEGGVLFLNPGSAGPRRFRLPVGLARLHIDDRGLRPEFVELEP
ncbi:MAG TPA: metallophosphoesterase family protein [Thermoanaerobaculaceae bacterium]|nr:metallophosphoesterase family protein [Thermoanaerobaculaceae bacterium]